jgi:hypothetical protein
VGINTVSSSSSLARRWAFNQFVSILSTVTTFPCDVIRHRLMMQASGGKVVYQGAWDCLVSIASKEGPAVSRKAWAGLRVLPDGPECYPYRAEIRGCVC